MSVATAGYAAMCLIRPDQLARSLRQPPTTGWRRLSYVYGVRDAALAGAALLPEPRWVRTAMAARIAADLSDCALLAARLRRQPGPQRKAVAATLVWAGANLAALRWDQRRAALDG